MKGYKRRKHGQYGNDESGDEPVSVEMSKEQKRNHFRCAQFGCPLPGTISHSHGPGIKYHCCFHIGSYGTDEANEITNRLRNLRAERKYSTLDLVAELRKDPRLDRWVRTGSYPAKQSPRQEPQQQEVVHESV